MQLDVAGILPLKERIIAQYGAQVADKSSLKTVMATNQVWFTFTALCLLCPLLAFVHMGPCFVRA